MNRKFIGLMAAAALVFQVSCKKETTASAQESMPTLEASDGHAPVQTIITPAPAEKPADGKYAEMKFTASEHDFGTIKQGDVVDYTFDFVNTGQKELVITYAKGSCGCTIPEYPKEPIPVGSKGQIKVSFNAAGKQGLQHKTVTLEANTINGSEKLQIKANVLATINTKK